MTSSKTYEIDKILQDMQSDYWRSLEEAEDTGQEQGENYLAVQSDGRRFGLQAPLCKEVLKLPQLVRVPGLPAHLRGILNLRGDIVAVTDLRALLGGVATEPRPGSRLVVVEAGPMKTALLVEKVDALCSITTSQVEPLAEGAATAWRDLFLGKVVEADQTLILLDLKRFLAHPNLIVDQQKTEETSSVDPR